MNISSSIISFIEIANASSLRTNFILICLLSLSVTRRARAPSFLVISQISSTPNKDAGLSGELILIRGGAVKFFNDSMLLIAILKVDGLLIVIIHCAIALNERCPPCKAANSNMSLFLSGVLLLARIESCSTGAKASIIEIAILLPESTCRSSTPRTPSLCFREKFGSLNTPHTNFMISLSAEAIFKQLNILSKIIAVTLQL